MQAAFGKGLDASLIGANPGTVTGGKKANLTGDLAGYAAQIAQNEIAHVNFLRGALGEAAIDRPALNIGEPHRFGSFATPATHSHLHCFDRVECYLHAVLPKGVIVPIEHGP